jgi:hypothetical protein
VTFRPDASRSAGNRIADCQHKPLHAKSCDQKVATGVVDNCASACALAWLAGVKRFMGPKARVGFHAAFNKSSRQETGMGNALVGAYLTKLGLPLKAVIYITKAALIQ